MNVITQCALKCDERLQTLRLRPGTVKADNEAVAFVAGYATALQDAGLTSAANAVGGWLGMVVAVRGAVEIRRLAVEHRKTAEG